MIACAADDLPLPVSPTMASVSPARTSNETSPDRAQPDSFCPVGDRQSGDLALGGHAGVAGLLGRELHRPAGRTAAHSGDPPAARSSRLPITIADTTAARMNAPGRVAYHQAWSV